MWHSIQQTLRNINSRISFYDLVSLGLFTLVLVALALFIFMQEKAKKLPVLYIPAESSVSLPVEDSRPFGSVHGTTYTYAWCSGSSQIKAENKIYFVSPESAENSGRVLSKLCSK
jgi:hypothetical protein